MFASPATLSQLGILHVLSNICFDLLTHCLVNFFSLKMTCDLFRSLVVIPFAAESPQESMKVREVIPHIGPIPIVIPLKLFLDLLRDILRDPVFP